MSQIQLSARGFRRMLKLARTIADLADSETIQPAHLAEALHLRPAEAATMSETAQTAPEEIARSTLLGYTIFGQRVSKTHDSVGESYAKRLSPPKPAQSPGILPSPIP